MQEVMVFKDLVKGRIIENIKTILEDINTKNGYLNNINRVSFWNRQRGDSLNALPCVIINCPSGCSIVNPYSSSNMLCWLSVTLDVWMLREGGDIRKTKKKTNCLLKGIEKALMQDVTCGGYAHHMSIVNKSLFELTEGNLYTGGIIEIEIHYELKNANISSRSLRVGEEVPVLC